MKREEAANKLMEKFKKKKHMLYQTKEKKL